MQQKKTRMERYKDECKQLGEMARHQLNLPKNRIKENFEDMDSFDIYTKLVEEVYELRNEFATDDKVDKVRALAEIGDCAAVLVGYIAKLKSL